MCGIAGIVDLEETGISPSRDALLRMAGALRHRGPGEFGIFRDARAGLAHARLSVIRLSTGQQPLSNAAATLGVVFNGQIFNYLELPAHLAAPGPPVRA